MSNSSPVFAPGVENYVAMGAVDALWQGDLAQALVAALQAPLHGDERARRGAERNGRLLAAPIAAQGAAGHA